MRAHKFHGNKHAGALAGNIRENRNYYYYYYDYDYYYYYSYYYYYYVNLGFK